MNCKVAITIDIKKQITITLRKNFNFLVKKSCTFFALSPSNNNQANHHTIRSIIIAKIENSTTIIHIVSIGLINRVGLE